MRIILAVIASLAFAIPAQADSPFSFYVGAHGAMANADLDFGAPVTLGSDGQTAGGRLGADMTFGQFFVGAFVDADKVFGNLSDLGVNWDASANVRAGAQLGSTKAYGVFGVARTFIDSGDLDAWQYGAGLETQLGESNWSLRLEYLRRDYKDVPFGLDLTADIVKGGVNYKF